LRKTRPREKAGAPGVGCGAIRSLFGGRGRGSAPVAAYEMWGARRLAGAIKSDGRLRASGSVDRLSRHDPLLSFTAIA